MPLDSRCLRFTIFRYCAQSSKTSASNQSDEWSILRTLNMKRLFGGAPHASTSILARKIRT